MVLFRILVGVHALTEAVLLYFFVEGLGDGTVSSDNLVLWMLLLLAPLAVIGGGFLLRSQGQLRLANLEMGLFAAPALLFALFVLMIVVLQPDFR